MVEKEDKKPTPKTVPKVAPKAKVAPKPQAAPFWSAERLEDVKELCDFLKACYDESEHVGVRTKVQRWRKDLDADIRRVEDAE